MRVLVTGGNGFIGRLVVARLLDEGHAVTVLDRAQGGQDRARPPRAASATVIHGDTREADAVLEAVDDQDVVIHLAAGSSFLMYERQPVWETNGAVAGFHNVLDAAVRVGVARIVYASTSAVYEGNDVPYRETMELHPPDLKAMAKKFNEELAELYQERYGIATLGLRPFSVYGVSEGVKGPYANVASLFAWAMAAGRSPVVWGSGEQTRDFVNVDDVADAFVLAARADSTGVANVGTGREASFLDIITILNDALGTSLDAEHVDVPIDVYAQRLLADPRHAEASLGFRAKVAIEQGIHELVAHARTIPPAEADRLATLQDRFRHGVERAPTGA